MTDLTLDGIDDSVREKVYAQDYTSSQIDGVKLSALKTFEGEQGDFSEVMRISEGGESEVMPGFKIRQINRSRLFPGSIKAWHLHLRQNEFWYADPQSNLFVGLWDVRKDSPTFNKTMKVMLGGANSKLLYIPHGVAHGATNVSGQDVRLYYFADQQFNLNDPDEKRIPWDALGANFWTPAKD